MQRGPEWGRIDAEEFGDDARHVGAVGRGSQPAVLAYSAVTDQVYAASTDVRGRTQISFWSRMTGWTRPPTPPYDLGEPLAMVVTPGRDRLLVVDRKDRKGALRLVLVDPLTGATTVVADRLEGSPAARVAIAISAPDKLLLALSTENRTELRHMELSSGKLLVVDRHILDGALMGDIAETSAGVHLVTVSADVPVVHTITPHQFRREARSLLTP